MINFLPLRRNTSNLLYGTGKRAPVFGDTFFFSVEVLTVQCILSVIHKPECSVLFQTTLAKSSKRQHEMWQHVWVYFAFFI